MTDGICILYVDDEPALLEMGKLFLEQSGEFTVDTLISASEALEILDKKNFDAIVSDYQMPVMNGIEFLKRVRAADTSIPFIIFTGRGREEVVIEALNNGADFYLQKGGNPDTLYTELMHVVRQSVRMKQTQAILAEREQRYHDLQNANDLIQSVAPDGHFQFVNKKWLDTLGYEEQDLPGLTIFDIIHEESLKHCMETFHRVISGEDVGIIDAVFKRRDGKRVFVEGIASCRMVEGKPQYTRGLFKDVTDRKLAESALRESEARYRDVVEDQTEFISRFRPDGTHVFVNDAYCRYYNKKREEIMGKRFYPAIPDEDRVLVSRHLASLTPEHPVATLSNRVILQDGRIRWQQWSNRAIFDDSGHIFEYQSVGRDITDLKDAEHELLRKNEEINAAFEELTATEEELRQNYELLSQKEQALRESEVRFRTLIESSPIAVLVAREGRMVYGNTEFYRFAGVEQPAAIQGKSLVEFIAPEYQRQVASYIEARQHGEPAPVSYEAVGLRSDGTRVPFEINVAVISLSDGQASLAFINDISARKRAEKELRAAHEQLTASDEELRGQYEELARNEQQIRESEEAFRAMVEQSSEGIIIVDFSGMLQFANRRAWDIIEYPSERRKAENFNVLEIVSQELRENALRDFIKVAGGTDSYLVNYKIITPEKTEKWIECIGKKITYKGSPSMLLSFRDITERRKTEYTVVESEKKFRTIFENSPYPISINSIPDGKFIAINAAFLHSSGYSEAEILGKSPIEMGLLSLLDYGRLSSHLLLSGKLENVPMVLVGKGGIRVHVQFSTIPVTINDRPAIMTMTAEITKLKRVEEELHQKNQELAAAFEELTASEEELRQNYDQLAAFQKTLQESEARFRTLFAISPDGIILFDLAGRTTFASPEALRMFRVSSMDEAIGTSVFDWVEPEFHELVKKTMVQLLDGKFRHAITYRVRRRDGSSFFVETSQGIFPDADNRPAGFIVIIRDITERQDAEMALLESEENFRKIFENTPLGMTLAQPDLRFRLVNPSWVSMMGYPEEELREMSFKDITHPDDLAGDIEGIRALEAGTIPVYSTEKRYIRKDGSTLWGALNVTTIRNQDGTLRHYLAQIEDITSRKQAEDALLLANRKLNLLSGITRHDIKNQLLALNGFLEVLRRKTPDPALKGYFTRITETSARISAMIEFTKEYEKIGVTAPAWQDTRTLVETAAMQAPLGKIIVKNDLPAGTEVYADPLVVKVIYNLMDNAARYGDTITSIRFSLQEYNGNRIIICEDDGKGIPADEKERIFERGFGKNTGLGLALSREILDIAGITIRETGRPGEGARFEIMVPKGMWRIAGRITE